MPRFFFVEPLSGVGRGLLRYALAMAALVQQSDNVITGFSIEYYIELCIAISLIVGIATPLSAISLSILFTWQGIQGQWADEHLFCLGGASLASAMIGPGPLSLDSLLFGRRRVRIPRFDSSAAGPTTSVIPPKKGGSRPLKRDEV
ncbi:hypothetical protein PY650_19315 [Rhizobium calliandrae]|uniref:Uncharacterized protein n=1 Tax=Rhizobium calliandrae TaxID=1312182 RepID=A0ABT7KGM4_9HYPH|nr:hypothetical protein [Rhizobium calliandrae]MDL2407769.1 hypothetical protein [Rhizobium calliandrae]